MYNPMAVEKQLSTPVIARKNTKLAMAMLATLALGSFGSVANGTEVSSGNAGSETVSRTSIAPTPEYSGVSKAMRAVSMALPSVVIIGESPGPADTTIVLVHVSGSADVTPLYVLGDNKTVISGSVIQPVAPIRAATVAVSKRPEVNQVEPGLSASVPAPASPEVSSPPTEIPAPGPSKQVDTKKGTDSVVEIPAPPAPVKPDVVADDVQSPGDAPDRKVAAAEADPAILIDSIESMVGGDVFGTAVKRVLDTDPDIDAVRNMESPRELQEAYYKLVKGLPAIIQGSGPRHIYVMFDPNCPVCHTYYSQVSNDVASGRVTVHWLPAIIFADQRSSLTVSAALAASVNSDDGGVGMLKRVMTEPGFINSIDQSDRVPALTPFMEPVLKNTAVMAMAKAETPLLIFQTSEGDLSISGGIPVGGYIGTIGVKTP